jgi:anti-sigma factor RsiW
MKEIPSKVDDETLQRYVDGELSTEQYLKIRDKVCESPELRRRLEAYQQITSLVSGLNRGVLSEPVPDRLQLDVKTFVRPQLIALAASLMVLCVGALLGWQQYSNTVNVDRLKLIDNAVVAHDLYATEVLHPVEVGSDQSEHLQKWLGKRIGQKFNLPSLEMDNYQLVGGRILPGDKYSPHGLLMYEKKNGERISVYITRTGNQKHTSTLYEERDGYAVFYWVDTVLSCAVVISINESFDHNNMLHLSNDIYEQLEI